MALLAAAAAAGACGRGEPPAGRGELWLEADDLFHRDARFLGADGAYTVDLGGDRILWLFGDSSIARTPGRSDDAYFIRNSVALQTGRDPTHAFLQYYWRTDAEGTPRSFFPEPDATRWFWPGAGIRLDDTLVLFGGMLRQDGPPGPDSFADDHAVAYLVDQPDADPGEWVLREATLAGDARAAGVELGEAVIAEGDLVYVFGARGDRHEPLLARFDRAAMIAGDLAHPAYWCGDRWGEDCDPEPLFSPGLPEYSVHFDERLGAWLYVGTDGYGATALAWRTAPAREGPWSDIGDVFRPPESYIPEAFVYAGKAHPELEGHGALVATYVPSLFVDLPDEEWRARRLYFPHMVKLWPR
jgi:hypothetical protein